MDRDVVEFLSVLEQQPPPANETLVPPGERECPICKGKMVVEHEYGITVDVCSEHGMWLDRGELAAVATRIRSGERIDRHQAVRRAKKDGKMSGAMFGVWSLLFD
jgi:Zn-finger nucleic acid-binding protein